MGSRTKHNLASQETKVVEVSDAMNCLLCGRHANSESRVVLAARGSVLLALAVGLTVWKVLF